MRIRLIGTFLLFTVISCLASGQWDSDQFLFEPKNKSPRPKTGTRVSKEPRSHKSPKEQTLSEEKAIEVSETKEPLLMAPTQPEAPLIALQATIGLTEINSKSSIEELNLSRETPVIGAGFIAGVSSEMIFGMTYLGTPQSVGGAKEGASGSSSRFRWDQISVELQWSTKLYERSVTLIPQYRQSSWWKTTGTGPTALIQVDQLGMALDFPLDPKGNWSPHIRFFFDPIARSRDSTVEGWAGGIGWSADYHINSLKSVQFELSIDRLDLARSPHNYLEQNSTKFLLSYRIQANR